MTPQHTTNQELVDHIDTFLHQYYHDEICTLASKYPSRKSLEVDFLDIYRYDNDLADDLIKHPGEVLEAFNEALRFHDTPIDTLLGRAQVRFTGFPEAERTDIGAYSADDIGTLVPVSGQVAKVSQKKPEPNNAVFVCQRCGHETTVPQGSGDFQEPYQCESCERQGPFKLDVEKTSWRDYQAVRVQQPPEQVANGVGATMDITLHDDLCEAIDPGDRATIGGVLSAADPSEERAFVMEADGIEPEDTDFDESNIQEHLEDIKALANGELGDIYELLKDSIAPGIYGEEYDIIKLGLALQLAAGVHVTYPDGSQDRGRFHILLLGDPGTAKSELVEAVNQVAPRSIFTSGENVSRVGLTASVVPDDFGDGKWSLEAGPMVKANEGICCVDEIDKAKEEAIEGLHTTLEKQIVTVSKASFNGVQMQARTGLLAAGNPKYGRFDPYEPVGDQIDISPTLMNRFDLMFMLNDQPDREADAEIIEAMTSDRYNAIKVQRGDMAPEEAETIQPAIDHDLLRAFYAYIHERNPQPVIPDDIQDRITEFLVDLRNSGGSEEDHPVPVTLRQVEAVERLVEASARLRLADEATAEDAKRAIRLVTKTMRDVGRDPETGEFDADIVETGTSQNQTQRRRAIMSLVDEQPDISISELKSELEDFEDSRIEHAVRDLKEKGDLYEPHHDGRLRRT